MIPRIKVGIRLGRCTQLLGLGIFLLHASTPGYSQAFLGTAPTAPFVSLLTVGQTPQSLEDLDTLEGRIKAAAKKAMAATVAVEVNMGTHYAHGSGVIVSSEGYVLTAAHVASRPGRRVRFRLADGESLRGVSLGMNETIDMGLMKITSPGSWDHIPLGSSHGIKIGQWCLATGHPGGFEQERDASLRVGRILKVTKTAFLTDCTLVGGDSGGPLVNLDGEVIGIHSRIGSDLTTNLHVPVDRYREDWDRLVQKESWEKLLTYKPWIGVNRDRLSSDARIKSVYPESPAQLAGLRPGDVVVEFDRRPVNHFTELKEMVSGLQPGQKVGVKLLRGESTVEKSMRIGFTPWIGVEPDEAANNARIKFVVQNSPAERAGLQAGDIVVQFDGTRVRHPAELTSLVASKRLGDMVAVQFLRGDTTIETNVEITKQPIVRHNQTRDDAELLRSWLDHIDQRRFGGRAVVHLGKNADQIKDVFGEALTRAKRFTVRVNGNGRQVAFGTIVASSGYILTKASRLRGNITCRIPGGREVKAETVRVIKSHDLALLKVDHRLPAVPFSAASMSPPELGTLLASSGQGRWPLAVGVVSGSPVKIPSEPRLGITMDRYGNQPRVDRVVGGSGADAAGVRSGDLILSINNEPVATASELIQRIAGHYPGDELQLLVARSGKQIEITAALGRKSDFDEAAAEFEEFIGGKLSARRTGFPRVLVHDTVILPSHCGGPVFDARGNFVGINIARADRTASYLILAEDVKTLVASLKSGPSRSETVDVGG